jgi:hypothetical protein
MVDSSPAVAGGIVYVGSEDNKTYALNATNGNLIWSYKTGGPVYSSPAVVGGVVYVGSNDGKVYAIGLSRNSDVAITGVTFYTAVGHGFTAPINVTVQNMGSYREAFNVTAYSINNLTITTSIALQSVALSSGTSATITLDWNTTGFARGEYTIRAYASPGPNETWANNNYTAASKINITTVADFGGGVPPAFFKFDGEIGGDDLALFLQCYKGTASPEAMFLADLGGGVPPKFFDCDGKVGGDDLALFLICYKGLGPT